MSGILLFLRLAAGTAVVLAPGWLIARALGVRGVASTLSCGLAAIFAFLGAAVGESAVPLTQYLTGESGWVTDRMLVIVPAVAAAAAVFSPALVPVGRWMMGVKRKTWKAMVE